jgi:TRAP-type C4-dicarboxylate transport system permease small subunit
MSVTQYLDRPALRKIERNFESYLAIIAIVVYTVIILNKIASRTFYPSLVITWQEEVTIGLFIWAAWLATASLVRKDGHIRFSLFIGEFSNRQVYVIYVIEWLLWLTLAGVVVYFSFTWVGQFVESGSDIIGTSVPKYFLYLSVPVGYSLIVVRVLQQAVTVTREYRAGEELSTESEVLE